MTDDEKDAREYLRLKYDFLDNQTADCLIAGFIEGRKGYVKAEKAIEVLKRAIKYIDDSKKVDDGEHGK